MGIEKNLKLGNLIRICCNIQSWKHSEKYLCELVIQMFCKKLTTKFEVERSAQGNNCDTYSVIIQYNHVLIHEKMCRIKMETNLIMHMFVLRVTTSSYLILQCCLTVPSEELSGRRKLWRAPSRSKDCCLQTPKARDLQRKGPAQHSLKCTSEHH